MDSLVGAEKRYSLCTQLYENLYRDAGCHPQRPTSSRLSQKDHKAWQTFLRNPHVKKTLDALMGKQPAYQLP